MNKKLIGACSVCLLAVAGFIGYTVYNNNKVEVEQTALSNDIKADQEVEATPVANQQNDNGEYVNGEPDVAIQVHDFFNRCMQYSFNIPDTANVPTEITDFQKENFSENYLNIMNNIYKGYKSIELVNCTIKSVEKTTMTATDGTKSSGYAIYYTATIKIEDGKIETFEENREYAIALISYENNRMLLRNLDSKEKGE